MGGVSTPFVVSVRNPVHREAATILDLALKGSAREATAKMQMGSKFNQLAAKLVNGLVEIGKSQLRL